MSKKMAHDGLDVEKEQSEDVVSRAIEAEKVDERVLLRMIRVTLSAWGG